MIQINFKKKQIKIIFTVLLAGLGILSMALKPKPILAAERISLSLPIFGEFHLSVDSLEVFAREGKITSEFNFYAKRLKPETLTRLRQILQKRFDVSPTTVSRMTNMPMGEQFLKQIGQAIYTHPGRNGLYAIRAALILAAADAEGLTPINVMRHFPTQEIQLNTKSISSLIDETANFLAYNEATTKAIAQQANSEVASQRKANYEQLPDLRQPGSFAVNQKTMTFEIEQVRQTQMGFADSYSLDADIYLPEGLVKPAPLVVLTHGFSSDRSHFQYLAEHLASHGYVVLVPEHIGSNSEYKEAFLRGELSVDVSPLEFYSRPLDITHLLDEIENHSEFQGLIDWEQVGVLGHSFGGNTALVVSGAPLNRARIRQVCQRNKPSLNASRLLQCRASSLPPGEYNLRDPRIKAVVGVNPVTSSILGPESMSQITIPTMILAGNEDIVTPFIEEQAHPFLWLKTQKKYLGVMVVASHNSTSSEEGASKLPEILTGVRPDLARSYLKAMSLAFFEVHLRDRSDYQPYLSSAYAQSMSSNQELSLYLVKNLTSEQLKQAYGDQPPTPPIPEPLVAVSPPKKQSVLAEIKKTQKLKIAMRTDAAPFGYIAQEGLWTGYCGNLADSLGKYLAQQLNIPSGLEVVKLPSNLENRFELVREDTVHLECGPNTIRADQEEVSFSDPFYASGSHFLVTNGNAAKVNPENSLEDLQTGVLENTTTAQFLQNTYPEAEIVYFPAEKGRMEGVTAVTNGKIDAFVSDGVLLFGEIDRRGLTRENYQLIPEKPLTCDFYGLILPEGDTQWQKTVNTFIRSQQVQKLQYEWLGEYFPKAVADLDYCLNK